jgi:hypothetical protein
LKAIELFPPTLGLLDSLLFGTGEPPADDPPSSPRVLAFEPFAKPECVDADVDGRGGVFVGAALPSLSIRLFRRSRSLGGSSPIIFSTLLSCRHIYAMQSSAAFRVALSADEMNSAILRYVLVGFVADAATFPRLLISCASCSIAAALVFELDEETP